MKEWTKCLNYLLLSSCIFLFSCSKIENHHEIVKPLTKTDSIIQLANDLKIKFNKDSININDLLGKIIKQKKGLIERLDSLDRKASDIEILAYQYKKKQDDKVKKQLLDEINKIKNELDRIKVLAQNTIIKKDSLSIPEKPIGLDTKNLESLPPGNYVTRLDRTHIISIFINNKNQIYIGSPVIDSISVISGNIKLSPRVQKEINQIKEKLKNEN